MTIKLRRSLVAANLEAVEHFLSLFVGVTEKADETWRKTLMRMVGVPHRVMVSWLTTVVRNAKFHAKFFALLEVGFDAWEPDAVRTKRRWKGHAIQKNEDTFRKDITILAGYFEVAYRVDGSLEMTAKSIRFDRMDDLEFEKLYSAVIDVLLAKILPHANREEVDEHVERILGFAS